MFSRVKALNTLTFGEWDAPPLNLTYPEFKFSFFFFFKPTM